MKVSVIIPVYNVENYLAECIDSVLDQTFRNFEIIAINDGSTDGSMEVLEKYKDKVRIFNQPNQGVALTLNRGIAEASGDYIAFIDGDDLWKKDKLEIQVGILEDNPDIDITFAEMEQFLSPDLMHFSERFRFEKGPLGGFIRIVSLVRKTAFQQYGYFTHVNFSEFIYWFSMIKEKGIRYNQTKHLVGFRRIRENSLSQNPDYYPSLLRFLRNRMGEKRNEA
jgi:glycosyltransferase involved in cell wall biosynthesis